MRDVPITEAIKKVAPVPWFWKKCYGVVEADGEEITLWALCDPASEQDGMVTDCRLVVNWHWEESFGELFTESPYLQFIQAASPLVVKGLLDTIARLEKEHDDFRKIGYEEGYGAGYEAGIADGTRH